MEWWGILLVVIGALGLLGAGGYGLWLYLKTKKAESEKRDRENKERMRHEATFCIGERTQELKKQSFEKKDEPIKTKKVVKESKKSTGKVKTINTEAEMIAEAKEQAAKEAKALGKEEPVKTEVKSAPKKAAAKPKASAQTSKPKTQPKTTKPTEKKGNSTKSVKTKNK